MQQVPRKRFLNGELRERWRQWAATDLLTTSMEWRDMSILTSTEKYSVIWLLCISFSSISMAISGLFSTRSGSLAGDRPMWYTSLGSFSSSANSYATAQSHDPPPGQILPLPPLLITD